MTSDISQYTDIQFEGSLTKLQTHHGEVGVVCGEAQAQLGLHLRGHPLQHAVKNVVVPLIWSLEEFRGRVRKADKTKLKSYNCFLY